MLINKMANFYKLPQKLVCQHMRLFSSYPPHLVVGMPALSPTMTAGINYPLTFFKFHDCYFLMSSLSRISFSGTIGKWLKAEGDKISAGDSIADIETDKASIAFEAQDDSYIARILVQSGVEVPVGKPFEYLLSEFLSIPF